jgi:type I restriction enzyme S subunit
MKFAALSEVTEIIMGQSPPSSAYNTRGEGLPFFQGKADFGDLYPTARVFCTEPKRIAEAGDILISVRAPVGPTNISQTKCCIGRGLAAIRCSQTIELKYLLFFLRFHEPELARQSSGSTFDAISRDDLENVRVPLLSLPEQKRIAAILDKAERLRRLRRYALELGDTYLQSVYLEMFGDPDKNPRGWEIKPMGTQIKDIRYGTGSPPEYQKAGVPFIRATNIKNGSVEKDGLVFISGADALKIIRCQVKAGNLILVRSGVNTGDCALIPAEYDGAYAAYDLIIEMPYPSNVYYNFLINSDYGKFLIQPLTRRAAQPHINAEQVKSLELPFPPISLQEKFAQVAQKFDRLHAQQREAERQAEHLFQSLLHRAFAGEL